MGGGCEMCFLLPTGVPEPLSRGIEINKMKLGELSQFTEYMA